ncbi:MAG TPA: L-serine ammonia-lyase, partial [Sphingorhabdus sp.]|nr:L-serine ammonia-lyase [Sphingorhabdus sp.]
MTAGVFDLFKIGVGPSSSHTVGPMVAAKRFCELLEDRGFLAQARHVAIDLYGSLALTGKGHASDTALIVGLTGQEPATADIDAIPALIARTTANKRVALLGRHEVDFDPETDMRFHQRQRQPYHSNAMAFEARGDGDELLLRRLYYSVGGGFVLDEDEAGRNARDELAPAVPFAYCSAEELLALGESSGLSFAEMMFANECASRDASDVNAGLDAVAAAMAASIDRGCQQSGTLPGGLNVKRRAPSFAAELLARADRALNEPLAQLDWINLWAMAVNEENAAGGRVVTAPTNGAAGIIPAVMRYHDRCYRGSAE